MIFACNELIITRKSPELMEHNILRGIRTDFPTIKSGEVNILSLASSRSRQVLCIIF